MFPNPNPLPVSCRRAFAQAFDLAARRDPLHSIVVPFLLQAPWVLAVATLPELGESERPAETLGLWAVGQLGGILIWLIIAAMLRFRARSVFNVAPGTRPDPVGVCYGRGLSRVPWLLVTEIVRNIAIGFGLLFLLLPGLYFGFRLAVATEAVVLDEPHLSRAFQRSYRYMQGRFERWLEMIVASVGLVLLCALFGALLSIGIPDPGFKTWTLVTELLIVAMLPFIVYAWTFFYLRLSEAAGDMGREVGPMYAAETETAAPSSRPPLTLVEPSAPTEARDPPDTDPRPSRPETHNWG